MAGVLVPALAWAQAPDNPILDPAKITGAEACGECHASTFEAWRKTTHATGFKTLHRRESAEAIAERLGLKLIKRDSLCLDCHYTPTERSDELRALSGVSCESCHGAGSDWIEVHNDYGGKGIDHTTETTEHRAQRIAASEAAGMRRGSDLYAVAASCYGCHTVPREELVNVGRHSLGSTDFELAAWISGEIRHNFLDSFLNGDGSQNAERPPEHQRRVYVLGRALDVEHGLRGVAEASEQGVFLKAMQGRLRGALSELRIVTRLGSFPELETILTTARGVRASLGHRDALLAAADQVATATKAFLDQHDGTQLASLDPLLVGDYDAVAHLLDDPEDALVDADPVDDEGDGEDATAVPGAPATAGSTDAPPASQATTVVVEEAIPAEGDKRSHLRPRSSHDTLAATACQKCHGDQHAWWYDNPHSTSVDPFLDGDPKTIKIARLYGLSPSRITRGDSLCMDCHGTVATARARREVQDGVSCQSCHGPAGDYFEPHQEGDKALGRQRPGYVAALGLGMVDLRDLDGRMRNCASCHYVTDPRLISSGHPTGADFDIASAMAEVRHWEEPVEATATLTGAWQSVLASRGPIPQVRQARLATTRRIGGAPGAPVVDDGSPQAPTVRAPRPARRTGSRAQVGAAAGDLTGSAGSGSDGAPLSDLDLPGDFPELDEAATAIDDVLLFLKERLEALYRAAPPKRIPRANPRPSTTAKPSEDSR